jgi:hypothetical protein
MVAPTIPSNVLLLAAKPVDAFSAAYQMTIKVIPLKAGLATLFYSRWPALPGVYESDNQRV